MSKECKHEWHAINPFQMICWNCNKVTQVLHMQKVSQKEFKMMHPDCDREVGPIIFNDAPDFKAR